MADKRKVHKSIKRLQVVKTWQLVILLILMGFVSATFLRLNNTGMIARRAAVLSADKAANDQETSDRLADLQRFTAAHMNADTGVFDLKEKYDRDVSAIINADTGTSGADSPQARADAVCRPANATTVGYSAAYQNCVVNELLKQGQVADPGMAKKLPNAALYRYSFISPIWSPDFAGWSVLLTGVILLIIILRLVILVVLRILLKRHYRAA